MIYTLCYKSNKLGHLFIIHKKFRKSWLFPRNDHCFVSPGKFWGQSHL